MKSLDAWCSFVRMAILFFLSVLSVASMPYAQEGAHVYRQLCAEEWKAHPEVISLCADNHRFAAERYKYRRILELARGGGDLDLGLCAQGSLKAEEAGAVSDWRRVEDCLLARTQRWGLAFIGAEGAVAVEAARYSCGLGPPVAVDEFDECFYRRLTEADARLFSPVPSDIKESAWKVYRLCVPTDKAVTGDEENLSLYSAFKSLNSNLRDRFSEMPRSAWRMRDRGLKCAFAAGQSKEYFLYWPKLELCYRRSTDVELSRLLEPQPLWSHVLSFYVCESRDAQEYDACLMEQFRATPPVCALFPAIDSDEDKDKKLRAIHVCEAAVRFDEASRLDFVEPFEGFYDLRSFRYCFAEQTQLMGISTGLGP